MFFCALYCAADSFFKECAKQSALYSDSVLLPDPQGVAGNEAGLRYRIDIIRAML